MLSVSDALQIVLNQAHRLKPVQFNLGREILGLVLAEDLLADRDSPPFDKSMMDGIAVNTSEPGPDYELSNTILAGDSLPRTLLTGQAMRIMTGASVPIGADAVIPVEVLTESANRRIRNNSAPPKPGKNILKRGTEYKCGDVILPQGLVLNPAVVGLLSSIGQTELPCYPIPRICVFSSGNEIVEPHQQPVGSQIRNSNGPMLTALAEQVGAEATYLGIIPDEEEKLKTEIARGSERADIVLISGGVSMGSHDLIPRILAELATEIYFHKIAMKPGKPLLFGKLGKCLVFGLPGNPVSSLVSFILFVEPVLRKLRGEIECEPKKVLLPLSESLITDNDRPTYLPGRLLVQEGMELIRPIPWAGSANLLAYKEANVLLAVPAGPVKLAPGERVTAFRMN
ncbi:molybdopterin molybdotransferase MoeA [Telmatocola sphagniphila]|uniref:Molybdopterin molybdenumtransferase n=1 Tax=Telmatocola sphagniphila TaxID=1123043 RepID=A0A8E6EZ31_9BACT|nr:gephyrin-like molybdotransferase Glp [Telmatocola sphagniphila]QVL33308.1 molybdopterin molybdotransferase MoeA [Telmatocola sphagniphila]